MPEGFGFKAWITTEDSDVAPPEYGVETDLKKNVVSCWISSEEGKKFKVMWNNLAYYTKDTSGDVMVDGIVVGGQIIYKSDSVRAAPAVVEETITSPTSVCKFVFSPVKLTDDDSLLGISSGQHIGSISLVLNEVKVDTSEPAPQRLIHEQNALHERSEKGLVHRVGFAPEVRKTELAVHNVHNVNRLQEHGTFIFKYRPLDILQANGIAPRDPPPETPTSPQHIPSVSSKKREADAVKDGDVEGILKEENKDPSEEMDSIRARLRELEREKEMDKLRARLRALEGKHGNAKCVKMEPHAAIIPGEVIDLT